MSRALLLPGYLCTAAFYERVQAAAPDLGLVARTPPGYGGCPVPDGFDYAIESYAELTERMAAREGVELLVGHSMFANVLIEVAARGRFDGPVMLLSPALRRSDEQLDGRVLDRLSRVRGVSQLAWAVMWAAAIPVTRLALRKVVERDRLIADMRRSDKVATREILLRYFDHLDAYGNLTDRLLGAPGSAWLVRGERDAIGFHPADRARLAEAESVTLRTVPGAGHALMLEQPAAIAAAIREQLEQQTGA